jgi:hypothetical protein
MLFPCFLFARFVSRQGQHSRIFLEALQSQTWPSRL